MKKTMSFYSLALLVAFHGKPNHPENIQIENGGLNTDTSIVVYSTDRNAVTAMITGKNRNVIFFYRNNKVIGADTIHNGNQLNTPRGEDEKFWNGQAWTSIGTPYNGSCMQLDIKGVISGNYSFISVRHGKYRNLIYFYAVGTNKVYRSREWCESAATHTKNGVAVTHHQDTIFVKDCPVAQVNDITCNASSSILVFKSERSPFFIYHATNWSNFPRHSRHDEKILTVIDNRLFP